jgi:NAD(P)-dependent dehydrogenase (short-subunit alcohol dehydrogenase family)
MSKPVCAVVGIGPGNGAAFARRFAAEGYRVALLSRSTDLSSELAAELDGARAYPCDAADPAAVTKAFEAVRRDLGDVEVLVFNAGSGLWGTVDELSAEDFELSWRVNALGTFCAAKEVIPAMQAAGRGTILIIGATASLRGKPQTAAFAAAKAAQRSLAQSLARQLWPDGIHVALFIIDGVIVGRGRSNTGEKITMLEPEDIAEALVQTAQQPRSAWSFEIDLRPYTESW